MPSAPSGRDACGSWRRRWRGGTRRSDAARRLFAERLEEELERADFAWNGWGSALNASAIFAFWEELEPGIFDPS